MGKENIAKNFAAFNVGGSGELRITISDGCAQPQIPLLEENDAMLKTARAFLSEQQADLLSGSTVAASGYPRRPRI